MSFQIHTTSLEALYADTDAMGIVYYGSYYRFFEAGRTGYVRTYGEELIRAIEGGEPYFFPVTESRCRYRRPAKVYDLLRLETVLRNVRRASFGFGYRLFRRADDVLLAEGETDHTLIDAEGRIRRFDEKVRAFLDRAAGSQTTA